jgi:predicted transcriptional regulator
MHDMLDSQLISLLENNASQTSEELASQLNASSSTIRRSCYSRTLENRDEFNCHHCV